MNILVLGGTGFFGKHLVWELLHRGHEVTIATRGRTPDDFGDRVRRLIVDRTDVRQMEQVFAHKYYDIFYDDLAYCAGDVRTVLEAVPCRRYVMVSSASVYDLHFQTVETDYEPEHDRLVWYTDYSGSYDVLKKSAECALVQQYPMKNAAFVRFPYVIGRDDYTDRLYFYVEHVVRQKPMYIDNMDAQMSFISVDDAGRLLAHLGGDEIQGAVNGASRGTISPREILTYVYRRTGKEAFLDETGDPAPYNGTPGYSINTERAGRTGFVFSNLKDWIYELLDFYIERAAEEMRK